MKRYQVENENQLRLYAIDKLLRIGSPGVTRERIMTSLKKKAFNLSRRTFQRDITRLIELGAPIEHKYSDGEFGKVVRWYYTDVTWTISNRPLTKNVFLALLLSQHYMEQYGGLPIAQDIRRAFDELSSPFSSKVKMQLKSLLPISFTTEQPAPISPEIWSQVSNAMIQRRRLWIVYQKGWNNEKGKSSTRTISPYHIVNLHGTWYLLGSADHKDPSVRQYAFSRILEAKMLIGNILIPESFDIKKILGGTFGRFIGDPDNAEEVHVRFNKQVAPLVMDRKFSTQEKKDVLPNGDIELRFNASSTGPLGSYNIKSWVLSWGADVEVLAPESLKTAVRDEIRKLAARDLPPLSPETDQHNAAADAIS